MSVPVDLAVPLPSAASLGRVHLVGVGGVGVSAVARVMLERGIVVSGSDAADVLVLAALRALGGHVAVGFDATRPHGVAAADTVVVGSAVRADNVEVVAARERGVVVLHRSQALAVLMHQRVLPPRPGPGGSDDPGRPVAPLGVAVAGTNGKTTTSAMLTAALVAAGEDPSYAIGGELVETGTNAHAGRGRVFVAEADESDGTFVVYAPHLAVVTNVQADHLDHHGDLAGVVAAFDAFSASITEGGTLVACADDPGAADLAAHHASRGGRVVTYGSADGADVRMTGVLARGDGTSLRLERGGGSCALELAVPGWHNALDAVGAYAAALELGADEAGVLAGLTAFPGTRRRFERRGAAAGVSVYDDYAHNPAKVASAVATGRSVAGPGTLTVIFQPHLYSRTASFATELGAALSGADRVVVMDVYGAREDPVPGVDGSLVARAVRSGHHGPGHDASDHQVEVLYVADRDAVVAAATRGCAPGDVLVTIGAGDVTALAPRVLEALASGSPRPEPQP